MGKKIKSVSIRKANTEKQICSVYRDNLSTEDYWIMGNPDSVTIAKQRNGESSEWIVQIPKKDFNKLIDFYNREQKIIR